MPQTGVKNIAYDVFCLYPFYQINIKIAGSIGQCCTDFYQDATNLNCKNLNIYEIWNFDFSKTLDEI